MPNQDKFDPMSIVGVKPTSNAKKAFDPMSIVGVTPEKKKSNSKKYGIIWGDKFYGWRR